MTPGALSPVGIFDSGVGGLTVARAIIDQLPDEDIVYEHARCGGFPAESVTLVSAVIDPSTGE